MKKIKALLNTTVTAATGDDPDHQKVHVLYVSPYLNSSGYYRMLLPYLELNTTTTHSVRLTSLSKWDFTKSFSLDTIRIDTKLLQWADYIVFPMLTGDHTYLLKGIKAIHPEVELVMDIDKALHKIHPYDPLSQKITDTDKGNLLKNMSMMDMITVANQAVLQCYEQLMETYAPEHLIAFEYLPDLMSSIGYQEITFLEKQEKKPVQIGILGTLFRDYDILTLDTILHKLYNQYKDDITLICIGWDGVLPDGSTPFEKLPVTFIKTVSFTSYFKNLHALELDMAVLPVYQVANKQYTSYRNFLELAALKIPVIATGKSVYRTVIRHDDTGILADTPDQWEMQIKRMIASTDLRKRIADNACKEVYTNHCYDQRNMDIFQDVFL